MGFREAVRCDVAQAANSLWIRGIDECAGMDAVGVFQFWGENRKAGKPDGKEDNTIYRVVVNHEEPYSIWSCPPDKCAVLDRRREERHETKSAWP